jgi:hypothetical protein
MCDPRCDGLNKQAMLLPMIGDGDGCVVWQALLIPGHAGPTCALLPTQPAQSQNMHQVRRASPTVFDLSICCLIGCLICWSIG